MSKNNKMAYAWVPQELPEELSLVCDAYHVIKKITVQEIEENGYELCTEWQIRDAFGPYSE